MDLVAQATTRTATFNGITYPIFDGDWGLNDSILTSTATLTLYGETYYLPSMGRMNRETNLASVNGFKRSSHQINGLIHHLKEEGATEAQIQKQEDDKARLAIIAFKVMMGVDPREKDGKLLHYEEAILTIYGESYECKILVAVEYLDRDAINVALSIMENVPFETKPPVRELTVDELRLVAAMNKGYEMFLSQL